MSNERKEGHGSSQSHHSSLKDEDYARDTTVSARTAEDMFPNIDESKVMRKVDVHVVPVLCLLYILAFLDRVNIANAAVFGMKTELGLKGDEYNVALLIFFVPYVVFEIPGNFLLKKFRPHVWLSLCMFLFGAITIAQGTVRNYSGLLATRFFLGLLESNVFPGSFYLIAMWYKRREAQKRYTFFFSSTSLAGAFGGLLATGIGKMGGVGGYSSWRWVFIIEGLATAVVSIFLYFIISDFPEEVKWLSEEEKAFIKQRLLDDVGDSGHHVKPGIRDVLGVFKDPKIIIAGFMYLGQVVPGYGYAYFAPAIIQSLGHSPVQTQLYSVPPWAFSFGISMTIAALSDWLRMRYIFIMIPLVMTLVGYAILISVHDNAHATYAALFLAVAGNFSAMPVIVCWFNTNLGGHLRRSVGTAFQIGFGNIGGIIAPFLFLTQDAPEYHPGYSVCLSFLCISALASTIYFIACMMENHRRAKGLSKHIGKNDDEKALLGDLHPDYRYML